ncbi:hypothetical protein M5E06_17950 [Azospirillum sp. A1-3]|uniref:hypothetical protein n=1 Tax=Azospirillum sp. A1-3 TaxID=185874 RepID=UPI00207767F2|nr:hypothetical protein [Azospirillum sp. A1-3]MCM8736020.1 hypothetical protein [Azospirillum sp. A1-3]
MLILALAGALLYRIRGGWLPTGSTQLARAVWCLPTGVLVWWLSGGGWWTGVAAAVAAFLGLMIPHNYGQDMGRMTGREWLDGLYMAAVGAARFGLIALPLADPSLWWVAVAGAGQALCYWLGWRIPVPAGWLNDGNKPVDAPTAWSELLWGGWQWGVLSIALGGVELW